jgi:hypothetical protein
MRSIMLASLLLLATGCASATAMNDSEVLECGPGQALEIQAGIEAVGGRRVMEPGDEVAFLVEVANNSHEDVVVTQMRIEPDRAGRGTGAIEPVYRSVNQEIAQGKDHLFRFPAMRRMISATDTERRPRTETAPQMTVTVTLADGDSYRCYFSLGL